MSSEKQEARERKLSLALLGKSFSGMALRLLALAIIDAFAILLLYRLLYDGVYFIAVIILITTLVVNLINLSDRFYPLRWMSPSIVIIMTMVLYPIFFTVYTAFTNYSDGHLLNKTQAIRRIGQDTYLPEEGKVYRWAAYRDEAGEFLLWLVDDQEGLAYLAIPDQPLELADPEDSAVGPLDADGFPERIEGYTRLQLRDIIPILDSVLAPLEFGEPPLTVRISSIREASQLQPRFVYDESQDAFIDSQTGVLYHADESQGFFTNAEGQSLTPGYQVEVGLRNFDRLLNSPALSGPFIQVFTWTIIFAFFSVVTTFGMGLFLALIYNDESFPGRKFIRALLILPYAIPGVIGVLIWRGMLNPHLGVISTNLISMFGSTPGWFTHPVWSKIGILLVNR